VVVQRTALSPHVIRVWERRYGAVAPPRTGTNRRLYSEGDVQRLTLLRRATLEGHSIGQIANCSMDELRKLVTGQSSASPSENTALNILADCKEAVSQMDGDALDAALGRASVAMSTPDLLNSVIGPLMEYVGTMWREGALRVANEHLATDTVRSFLAGRRATHRPHSAAPAIVITTPSGQTHEIGALMASLSACTDGWRDVYLGPNLPCEDIVAAVSASRAVALALSIVYPANDPVVTAELAFLAKHLPRDVAVFVGGRCAHAYAKQVSDMRGTLCNNLEEFRAALEALRQQVNLVTTTS
ncbi:MAG TPA: MerR family transcriptional regulator, partial [Candidatus Hydrogenedentes bacterium]|nr:MerR family transcriptional regulator [Candidatus Hydrogenedentota bacterium]